MTTLRPLVPNHPDPLSCQAAVLIDRMRWVEVPVADWLKACTPHTKSLPDTTVLEPWRVPKEDTELGMHVAVNDGCNDYLKASGCTSFIACCTDSFDDNTAQESDEDYSCNTYCPNPVISPKHPDATSAYQWKGNEIRPSPIEPQKSTTHRAARSMAPPVPGMAEAPRSDDASLQDVVSLGDSPPPRAPRANMSWAWAEVLVLVEARETRFPFLHGDYAEFAPDGERHILARGQIAEYALEVFRHQHRQAVFMLLILDDHARFVRFDPAGAVVSAAFNYRVRPRTIGEFFYRLFNENARPDQRGHDPTARLVTGQDAEDFRQLRKRFANQPDTASALEFAGTSGWPVYDLEVTGTWSPDGDSPLTTSSSSAVTTHICRVGRPFTSTSVVGRGTRCFAAYDMTLNKPIFIKDTWRADSPTGSTEAESYKTVWGRVAAMQAERIERNKNQDENGDGDRPSAAAGPPVNPYVPTLICYGDVSSPASSIAAATPTSGKVPIVQRTLTHELSGKSRYTPRIHHRLVFKEICNTIADFRTPYELAAAVYSALLAHQFAWEQCGILHRDVSVGNILLYRNSAKLDRTRTGLLANWDSSTTQAELENIGAPHVSRSGTWQFMSALMQNYVKKAHAVSDDLESFLHVLNWCAPKYLPHAASGTAGLPSYFFHIYDKVIPRPLQDGARGLAFEVEGPAEKFLPVRHGRRVVSGFPVGHPLDVLLDDLTALCKNHYDTVDFDYLDPKEPAVAVEPDYSDDECWELDDSLYVPVDEDATAAPITRDTDEAADAAAAARSPQESPLKDHAAFRLAFYRAVVKRRDDWRKPRNGQLVKVVDQIRLSNYIGSAAPRHERVLALPTRLMKTEDAEETAMPPSRQHVCQDSKAPDNPRLASGESTPKKRKTAA